jgi:hypothetical protein
MKQIKNVHITHWIKATDITNGGNGGKVFKQQLGPQKISNSISSILVMNKRM